MLFCFLVMITWILAFMLLDLLASGPWTTSSSSCTESRSDVSSCTKSHWQRPTQGFEGEDLPRLAREGLLESIIPSRLSETAVCSDHLHALKWRKQSERDVGGGVELH